jgi:hypothetical protein
MAECKQNYEAKKQQEIKRECKQNYEAKKQQEIKRLFEGEYSTVLAGDSEDWLWDEDEEFQFDVEGGNKWFKDAFAAGMRECELMRCGGVERRPRNAAEENAMMMKNIEKNESK